MSNDDVSRADAPRGTNDGTRRRTVLAGVTGVVGATMGLSSAAAASKTTGPDAGGAGPEDAPYCEPGCVAVRDCCGSGEENCADYCWYCDCS